MFPDDHSNVYDGLESLEWTCRTCNGKFQGGVRNIHCFHNEWVVESDNDVFCGSCRTKRLACEHCGSLDTQPEFFERVMMRGRPYCNNMVAVLEEEPGDLQIRERSGNKEVSDKWIEA